MILILRDFFRSSVTLYKMWDCFCKLFYHLSVKIRQEQSSQSDCLTSTKTNYLLAKVLTIASSFFVPFVAVSQGFTEISAANRESQKWTYSRVFWIKKPRFSLFLSNLSSDDFKIHKVLESKILQKHTPKYLKSLFLKIENIKVL